MAQLTGNLQIIGSLNNLSFYKMRGSDKIIVRKKGGPSSKQVKKSPRFESTRRNNKEFGGRSLAAKHISSALFPLHFLADYNITGPINALLKPIQELDTDSDWGKRNILISKNPRLLEGFSLNRRYLFESIVRTPVSYSLQDQQAIVEIPELIPGINFMAPGNYPCYQFIAVTKLVPDIVYKEEPWGYQPIGKRYAAKYAKTDWLPLNTRAAATQLIIKDLPADKPESYTMLVSLGISVGILKGATIEPVKYVGAARIIGVE
jgi:hypothetical protein